MFVMDIFISFLPRAFNLGTTTFSQKSIKLVNSAADATLHSTAITDLAESHSTSSALVVGVVNVVLDRCSAAASVARSQEI